MQEQRFRRLNAQQPDVAEQLWKDAAADLQKRYDFLAQMVGKRKNRPASNSSARHVRAFFAIKKARCIRIRLIQIIDEYPFNSAKDIHGNYG